MEDIKEVYVLYFNEWGWEEGEDNLGHILGVFTKKSVAESHEELAKIENDHGNYNIIKVPINKFTRYGY